MRIIAVRHAETIDNDDKIMRGHGHGKLSKLGLRQAQSLAKILKNEKFDFIYCSDLRRCKQTLEAISRYHKNIPVIFTKDLRERNWGILEGKPYAERDRLFELANRSRFKFTPKGAESLVDVRRRVRNFLAYIQKQHPDDHVLLVTSGGTLRQIYSLLTKTSLVESYGKFKFKNTSVNEYEIGKNKVRVHRLNDISHLGKL